MDDLCAWLRANSSGIYRKSADAADEIERLRDENAKLRADAERLDWIQDNARCDPKMDGHHVWWPTSFNKNVKGPTIRAAIDAAMREGK